MSIEGEKPGGKAVMEAAVSDAKRLVQDAAAEECAVQDDLFEPLSAEELAEAQEQLGPSAGPLAVHRQARKSRRGRPPGVKNKRTDDLVAYLSQYGPDPAVAMMRIIADSEEAMVERSRAIDPIKKQMSFGAAKALRIRCAETMMPYFHGKKPVAIDATIRGVHLHETIGRVDSDDGSIIDGIVGVAIEHGEGRDDG